MYKISDPVDLCIVVLLLGLALSMTFLMGAAGYQILNGALSLCE